MQAEEAAPRDLMIWWQNRFPTLAAIVSPYVRTRLKRELKPETCFLLRIAYFVAIVSEFESELVDLWGPFSGMNSELRQTLIDDLGLLQMDALVKYLNDYPYGTIANYVTGAVAGSLERRLGDYLDLHRSLVIDDLQQAIGQSVVEIDSAEPLSDAALEQIELMSLTHALAILKYIESADAKLKLLREEITCQGSEPDKSNFQLKRRCLDFRLDVNRQINGYSNTMPLVAEEWFYDTLEEMDSASAWFGK